ncbi:MAG: hypothetical protein H0U57_12345 [Tatlockia sp.]|nr:hypothetical protein [Tatlockia sp.]
MAVFAICGPIGSPLIKFVNELKIKLDTVEIDAAFLYESDFLNKDGRVDFHLLFTIINNQTAQNIIVIGNYLYSEPNLNARLDVKFFIDTPHDICLANFMLDKISKDEDKKNSMSIDTIKEQNVAHRYLTSYEQDIKPENISINSTKKKADIYIPYDKINELTVELLAYSLINEKKSDLNYPNSHYNFFTNNSLSESLVNKNDAEDRMNSSANCL